MSVVNHTSINALEELGLTQLEALTYVALLRDGPGTAYSIAKAIQKPASNAYRIIEGLISKQLVVTEEGSKKRFRALPWEQMLDRLGRRFRENQEVVARELSSLQASGDDDRVYRLNSTGQVFERCLDVLENASELVMIDAFPDMLCMLIPDIEAALTRGIEVRIKTYKPIEISGASVSIDYRGEEVLEQWKIQWLVVIADGNEYVQACFEPDGKALIQAIWTRSAFLSWVAHGGLSAEMTVDQVQLALQAGGGLEDIQSVIDAHHSMAKSSLAGRRRLMTDISV